MPTFAISQALREKVRDRLGRVASDGLLDTCIESFALYQPPSSPGTRFRWEGSFLDEKSTVLGAEIARAVLRAASQTYERNVLTTGVLVCPLENCIKPFAFADPEDNQLMVMRFAPPLELDWSDPRAFLQLAQLVNGKDSLLLCDTGGMLHGVISTESYLVAGMASSNNGYAITSTKNRETQLWCPWKFGENPVATFDGFEWSYKAEPLSILDSWYSDVQCQRGDFVWLRVEGREIVPGLQSCEKWRTLLDLIGTLSELRLSSIVAFCTPEVFEDLVRQRHLLPMRPELTLANWEPAPEFGLRHLPLFRVDGAHFLSTNLEILGIALQVAERLPQPAGQTMAGAGRLAARRASEMIGPHGIVAKISSDGPIKLFRAGEQVTSILPETDWTHLVSRTEGPYPGKVWE